MLIINLLTGGTGLKMHHQYIIIKVRPFPFPFVHIVQANKNPVLKPSSAHA